MKRKTLSITTNTFHDFVTQSVIHAQDGVIHPQQITVTKVKFMKRDVSLLDGLFFSSFISLENSRLISPKTTIQCMFCKFRCYNLLYMNYITKLQLFSSHPVQLSHCVAVKLCSFHNVQTLHIIADTLCLCHTVYHSLCQLDTFCSPGFIEKIRSFWN